MFYNARRRRDLYRADLPEFRLSRSRIEDFIRCPRCFYLDRKLGVAQPPSFPMNLNNAVDKLLKKEFDIHRARKEPHPLMKAYGLDAVPFAHPQLEEWREARTAGITCALEGTNFLITGGVDDIWVNPEGELIIVDYKATSKASEVSIDAEWQQSYKRQMAIYQWLFRKNGFRVAKTGYFVYANGDQDRVAFDGKLEFSLKLIPFNPEDGGYGSEWVEEKIRDAYWCLNSTDLPRPGSECEFCEYRKAAGEAVKGMDVAPVRQTL